MQDRMGKAELSKLASEIVTHLGPGWSVKPCDFDHLVKIGDDAGHVLSINSSWDGPGKLRVCGDYPRDKNNNCYGQSAVGYRGSLPRIGLSDKKTAKQIAADIKRRLLPEYFSVHAKAVEIKQKHDDYAKAQGSLLSRLATVPGVKVNTESGTFDTSCLERAAYAHKGSVSSDRVSMDLNNLSEEQAILILKIVIA